LLFLAVLAVLGDSESSCHYAWNNAELSIIASLPEFNLILCYSSICRVHSLHFIKKAIKSEWMNAASKAESMLSTSNLQTPGSARTQPSTPHFFSHSLSKSRNMNDDFLWATPKSTSVRTRSMTAAAALAQSLPFPSSSPSTKNSIRLLMELYSIYKMS
uniref:Secreted protein n=1 Tax=Dracunculus medinensis TaxID=318479 RepID=A0A0N4U6M0_DRAME